MIWSSWWKWGKNLMFVMGMIRSMVRMRWYGPVNRPNKHSKPMNLVFFSGWARICGLVCWRDRLWLVGYGCGQLWALDHGLKALWRSLDQSHKIRRTIVTASKYAEMQKVKVRTKKGRDMVFSPLRLVCNPI